MSAEDEGNEWGILFLEQKEMVHGIGLNVKAILGQPNLCACVGVVGGEAGT